MGKKRVVVSSSETTAVVVEQLRGWEGLNPEILALIFVRIPADAMVRGVPFVCKPWMEVVAGPYCWHDIDVEAWCRRRDVSRAVDVDFVVKKLVRRSKFTVQRLSAYRLGESGFFLVSICGRSLKVLQSPMSSITDYMVIKHIKPLPNLKLLDISHCYKITHKGIAAFGNHCKSLIHLKRRMPPLLDEDCSPIDDSEAKTIATTMVSLQRIELCFGRFGDMGISEIVTKCKSLTHLDIEGSCNVELNYGDLKEICESLEHFRCPQIDYSDGFFDNDEASEDVDSVSSIYD
ncbi:F-box protein FBW2-like [Cynara cardunculus var. scolymus]|uniref:F-box domain, cyclin-like protein n=1 Tax=Cynara cardunculus var. scolymus TaxID=59895 RepID=A0A103Y9X2_CYNCS|nr:F-box protein FBW2-like [Cynara cardunculus var. scolymus]KVI05226.1 F-box domain, cyclin-like protein [Cynara cardunculus var. scolymus]